MDDQLRYVRDVLGVESFISPDDKRIPIVAVTNPSWSDSERALADKIFASVGVEIPRVSEKESKASHHVVIFDFDEQVARLETANGQIVWSLGSLSHLLTGDRVPLAKREVWDLIKRLKAELI